MHCRTCRAAQEPGTDTRGEQNGRMKSEFLLAFNQICSERNLPKEVVLEALQIALISAYRRNTNASSAQNIVAKIDGNTGQAKIFCEKEVVEVAQDERTEVGLTFARQIEPE